MVCLARWQSCCHCCGCWRCCCCLGHPGPLTTQPPSAPLTCSCCGMMFNSRGFKDAAAKKGAELEAALLKASENGELLRR